MQLAVVLTPLMGLFLVWAWRRKRSALRLFIRSRLMDELTVGLSWRRQQVKAVLWVAGLALSLIPIFRARRIERIRSLRAADYYKQK